MRNFVFGRFKEVVVMRRILAIIAALMLTGCSANFRSIYRAYKVDSDAPTTTVLIDAKQRAIISMPNPKNDTNPKNDANRVAFVCAEPSPDALSVVSAAFAAGSRSTESEHILAGAITETAKQLGRRNATIQLLRDGLYRQCEAYMNGLIGPIAYESIANKYVNAMVVLLAIEEITRGPGVDTGNGEEPGDKVPTKAEVNMSAAVKGDGDGKGEPPKTNPTEPSNQDGTDGGETPDDSDPAEADREPIGVTAEASGGKPVVEKTAQGGNAAVSKAVAEEVSKMTQAFLDKDTLHYCLYVMGLRQSEISRNLEDICKMIVLSKYNGEYDSWRRRTI